MYVPRAMAVDDPAVTLALLRAARVGHLVTTDPTNGLDATLVPFVVDDGMTSVRAHLARANPQWRAADGVPALLLVPCRDAYVSPGWYPSKADGGRVVPTWNYEVVHVHGTLVVHDDPAWIEDLVRDLTERHEGERWDLGPDAPPWSVDDAPREHLDRQLRAVVGVELRIERIEAKRKLSQNKSDADHAGVADALAASPRPADRDVARAMRSVDGSTSVG